MSVHFFYSLPNTFTNHLTAWQSSHHFCNYVIVIAIGSPLSLSCHCCRSHIVVFAITSSFSQSHNRFRNRVIVFAIASSLSQSRHRFHNRVINFAIMSPFFTLRLLFYAIIPTVVITYTLICACVQGHVQFSMGFRPMWLVCSLVGSNSWQLSRLLVVVVVSSCGLWSCGTLEVYMVGLESWR